MKATFFLGIPPLEMCRLVHGLPLILSCMYSLWNKVQLRLHNSASYYQICHPGALSRPAPVATVLNLGLAPLKSQFWVGKWHVCCCDRPA